MGFETHFHFFHFNQISMCLKRFPWTHGYEKYFKIRFNNYSEAQIILCYLPYERFLSEFQTLACKIIYSHVVN